MCQSNNFAVHTIKNIQIMRRLLLLFTLALEVVAFSSCSGEKSNSEKTQEEVAETAKDTDFDIDRLKVMTDANKKEIIE